MVNFHSTLYKLSASSCGALVTIPFDILQTKAMCNKNIELKLDEFKYMFYMVLLFTLQSIVYDSSKFIKSKMLRGALSGLASSPIYIYVERKKLESRLQIYPKIKNLLFWITIRQTLLFITLYNVINSNIPYSKFLSAFFANLIGFPLRLIALKKSYNNLNIDYSCLKKTCILEILKSTFGDGITLTLIYKQKYLI